MADIVLQDTDGQDIIVTPSPPVEIDLENGISSDIELINSGQGLPGVGVPTGGLDGQVLAKASNTDYDTEWVNQSGGGGISSVIGTTDRIVVDSSDPINPEVDISPNYIGQTSINLLDDHIMLGGATSSQVGIFSSGTTAEFRLADNSSYTSMYAAYGTFSGDVTSTLGYYHYPQTAPGNPPTLNEWVTYADNSDGKLKAKKSDGTVRILSDPDSVTSVAGKSGAVTLVKADVGLSNVDDTSDATKNAASASLTNKNLNSGTNTFPTFNQNTTGSAATLTTARTIGTLTGDVTTAGSTFNGSANNTNATVLATVNSNVGSFTNASVTVNGKGLVTAASSGSTPEVPLTFSTGLTRSTNTVTVNTSQNISALTNLTSNGLVKTSGGGGTLSIATAGTDYQAPISLTTTGTSGAATFIANTLNIPNYAGGGGSAGITRSVVVTSGNVSAGATSLVDYVYIINGNHTVTLPTAVGNTNLYTLKNRHSAAVALAFTSSQTADGGGITLSPNDSVDLVSDGTNWVIT